MKQIAGESEKAGSRRASNPGQYNTSIRLIPAWGKMHALRNPNQQIHFRCLLGNGWLYMWCAYFCMGAYTLWVPIIPIFEYLDTIQSTFHLMHSKISMNQHYLGGADKWLPILYYCHCSPYPPITQYTIHFFPQFPSQQALPQLS